MTEAVFRSLALSLAVVVSTAAAGPEFSARHTVDCLEQAETASPSRSGDAVLECIGLSARACMQTPDGDTTFGMMECLRAEVDYWEERLAVAYQQRLETARAQDLDRVLMRSAVPAQSEALVNWHDRWQEYRQAACLYEQSLWMGGTGGGPATLSCHLDETARHTLRLEGWWSR